MRSGGLFVVPWAVLRCDDGAERSTLPRMPTSVEQLDQARADVHAATGPEFLRRLADYCRLLEDDPTIGAVVQQLHDAVAEAEARLTREDTEFVADLVPIRRDLAEREPETDDSNIERPERYDPANRAQANQWHQWIWTLANFDAIAEDRDDKIVQREGLDNSRSRMLVAILDAKLHDLVFPFNERPAPRLDLMDLWDRTNAIGRQQIAAYRRVERFGEESGFLGLMHIKFVVGKTDPDPRPLDTDEQRREFMEEAMQAPDLVNVREVLRPKEARGPLADDELKALGRVEENCRPEIDRLHRPLRQRVAEHEEAVAATKSDDKTKRRTPFTREEKLSVGQLIAGIAAVVLAAAAIVVAILLASGGGS